MKKEELRKEYISIRNNIISKNYKSNIICNKIINDKDFYNSRVIALYKSLKSEVNTDILIDYALQNNKIVLLPKVCEDVMNFYKVNEKTKYVKSNLGIYEPVSSDIFLDKDLIDIMIVPGICFDLNKNRIGFGKGYYDKYLYSTNIYTLGICFDDQITDKNITNNNYDVKVKRLISEKRSL